MAPIPPAQIIDFWKQAGPKQWFGGGPALDAEIAMRFSVEVARAIMRLREGPHPWESAARGVLALLILTDQFPRNIYRGLPLSWANDPLALGVARRAVAAGQDREMGGDMRVFFYLPFSHSEAMADQDRAVEYCEAAFGADSAYAKHARAHRRIIERFGEFPERNAVLGRPTTEDEQRWIRQGGYAREMKAEAA